MKCSSSAGGHWRLKPTLLENADLRAIVNNKLWRTYKPTQMPRRKPDHIDVMGRSDTRLRLELVPEKRNTEAKAKFALQAFNVDASVYKCLEVTDCMNVLSQQSGQGFALRNSKYLQLQCLLGKLQGWAADLKKVCGVWVKSIA